jgi:hypothetical protein
MDGFKEMRNIERGIRDELIWYFTVTMARGFLERG